MRKFYYYTPIFLQKVGYVVFYVLHKIFVRIEIRGRKNLSNLKGPIILALNHTSELDVTASPLILPFLSPLYPIYYVNNPIEKYNNIGWRKYIYGGIFFNMLGGYVVRSGLKDYGLSLEDHIDLLDMGRTVLIFPEGIRTLNGKLSLAHGGMGYMAHVTNATVIPVAINTFYNINCFKYFGRTRKVIITILPPIFPDELITALNPTVNDFKHASQVVLDKIREVL